jgi:hypothetical protein
LGQELDDAVTKYRLLVRDTAVAKDADKDVHTATQEAIDKLKADHENRLKDHDKEKALYDRKIAALVHECAKKVASLLIITHFLSQYRLPLWLSSSS